MALSNVTDSPLIYSDSGRCRLIVSLPDNCPVLWALNIHPTSLRVSVSSPLNKRNLSLAIKRLPAGNSLGATNTLFGSDLYN